MKEEFPIEGKTDYNEAIYQYLKDNDRSIYDGQQYNPNKHEAIAWNETNIWGISCSAAGSKPYFSRASLLDFINPKTFEKGKWYKNLGTDKDYIAKFDKLRGDGFWVSEYIDNCKKYYHSKGTVEYDYAAECTLEEIQQYLPDGHVDKIIIPQYVKCIGLSEKEVGSWSNNYEIGKIYKTAGKSCSGNYNVFFDEFNWLICDKTQFIPSTKEEFDAQNKPKEVTPEYKVSDWVLVKGCGNGLSYKEEKIVQLIDKPNYASGHEHPDYYFKIDSQYLGTQKDYIVRKATEAEIGIAKGELAHENFEKTINGKIPETVPGISGKLFWREPVFPMITKEVIQTAKKKDPLSYSAPVKIKNKNKLFKF